MVVLNMSKNVYKKSRQHETLSHLLPCNIYCYSKSEEKKMSKWDFKISIKEDKEFLQDGFNRIIEDAVKHDEPMTYEELERSMLEEFHNLKEASIKDLEWMYEELGEKMLHTLEIEKLYGYYSRIKYKSDLNK
jgi:hypothetical protein